MKQTLILDVILCVVSIHYTLALTTFQAQAQPSENEVFNPKPGQVIQTFAAEDLKQFAPYSRGPLENTNYDEVIDGQTVFPVKSSNLNSDANAESEAKIGEENLATTESNYLASPIQNNDIQPSESMPSDEPSPVRIDDVVSNRFDGNERIGRPAFIDDTPRFNRFATRNIYDGSNQIASSPFRPSDTGFVGPCGTGPATYENIPTPRPFHPNPWSSRPYPYYPERFRRMNYYYPEFSPMFNRMYGAPFPFSRYSMMPPMQRMFPPHVIIYKLLQPIIIKSDQFPFENEANRWPYRQFTPEKYYGFNSHRYARNNNFGMHGPARHFGQNINSADDSTIHIKLIYKD